MPERHKDDKSNKPLLSRLEMLQSLHGENYTPEMPPIDSPYIVEYLYEIGPAMASGFGSGPISNGEIESWQRVTGIELTSWEARTLSRLSREYLSESHKATEIDCPAPWSESEYVAPNRKAESMRLALRKLAEL